MTAHLSPLGPLLKLLKVYALSLGEADCRDAEAGPKDRGETRTWHMPWWMRC